MIRIEAFDCEKREEFPGLPAPKGLVAPTNGIRSWLGGGPGGANWNVEDLRCTVRASTSCSRGRIGLVLRVGTAVVAERREEIGRGSVDFEVPLPLKSWKAGLDQPSRKVAANVPYRTAAFRALVMLECAAPSEVSLKNSAWRDVTDENALVAGFASGE